MQSPPVEWTLAIGYLAALDYLRSRGDADDDTISECLRPHALRHPLGFAAACVVAPVLFHQHITRGHLVDRLIRVLTVRRG
jgi:hypothetical protein